LVPKRKQVIPELRKLHNEEFNDLNNSSDVFELSNLPLPLPEIFFGLYRI